MDELKKYLQNHPGGLDLDEPRPQVWQNIRQELGTAKKTNVVMLVTRWAAAACVLALAGIGAWYMISDKETVKQPETAVVGNGTTPTTTLPGKQDSIQPQIPVEEPAITAQLQTASKNNRMVVTKPAAKTGAVDAGMLNEIESSFTQVINLQRARVSTMPMYAETPEYFDDFKVQIKSMERDEKNIKSEISRRGMNDVLLDQLINLYQQKLNVLKQLQIEMNKTNNRFKQNRGPVDSTRTYFLNI